MPLMKTGSSSVVVIQPEPLVPIFKKAPKKVVKKQKSNQNWELCKLLAYVCIAVFILATIGFGGYFYIAN